MTRATTPTSNAPTRGDPGLEAGGFGPNLFGGCSPIVRRRARRGQVYVPGASELPNWPVRSVKLQIVYVFEFLSIAPPVNVGPAAALTHLWFRVTRRNGSRET